MSLATGLADGPPAVEPDWALYLDLDGTLAEVAETPDAVRLSPGLPDRLARLRDTLGGALALVSGRPIALLDRLFSPHRLAAVGLHGGEWRARPDGPIIRTGSAEPVSLARLRPRLDAFAARHPGVVVEDKGGSLALHYRRVPEAGPEAQVTARAVAREMGDRYHAILGKMMIEIKPNDVDKGSALRRAMAEPPFAGRTPVFVGDDVTDEDGFAAVNELGGYSIKVGLDGLTRARYRLADVSAVHRWLEAAIA